MFKKELGILAANRKYSRLGATISPDLGRMAVTLLAYYVEMRTWLMRRKQEAERRRRAE